MNILVVLAHPDPGSFNHALANAAAHTARRLGQDVVLHDLYAERFDPVLPSAEIPRGAAMPVWLQRHCADRASATPSAIRSTPSGGGASSIYAA